MKTSRMWMVGLSIAICANGCGKSTPEVSGTVRYQGQILTTGEVRFFGTDLSRTALIGADGTYVVNDCPPGAVHVAVISMKGRGEASAFGKKGSYSPRVPLPESAISEKYNDPKTSGLVYDIKPGHQQIDIALTD